MYSSVQCYSFFLLLNFQILGGTDIAGVEQAVKDKVEDLLVKHRLSDAVPLTNLNKDIAIHDLLVAEVLVTRTVALDTIFKGLNCLGLSNLLRKHQIIDLKHYYVSVANMLSLHNKTTI